MELPFHPKRSMVLLVGLILLALSGVRGFSHENAPRLNGEHFRITVAKEDGFVNVDESLDGSLSFSGFCIDMLRNLAKPDRANFTFDLMTPSGYGSQCSPQLGSPAKPYTSNYHSQYKCGESDVTDIHSTDFISDMYLGLYYVTPERQQKNLFTLPFHPPGTGTLQMFGTATGINNFAELAAKQEAGEQGPACAGTNTAYVKFLKEAFPKMEIMEVTCSANDYYEALLDGKCDVIISDNPVATRFVLQRSLANECSPQGKPIGIIGEPLGFGLSQYAIGVRNDLRHAEEALSYWLNVLMTCSPGDPEGDCPFGEDGNLYSMYDGVGGRGDECGYILHPFSFAPAAIAGIAISCLLGALFIYVIWRLYMLKKRDRLQKAEMKIFNAKAEAEKAAIIVENATMAARRERELNDFISHEVRNPLSAAMSACSFVSTALEEGESTPFRGSASLNVKEDLTIINSSLHFINDLLRNMLDMNRASSNQMKIEMSPICLLRDVLEPVDTMLYQRGKGFQTYVDCPSNLIVSADGLRLKQIILNLGRNAAKFVNHGFVRLRAAIVEGHIRLYVEDSGPGIPLEKRGMLFAKFQDSLDSLNQGTGIGLNLCKQLADLMNADLWLDESYDSGVKGCPGARFVINLNTPPLKIDDEMLDETEESDLESDTTKSLKESVNLGELPGELSALFVDDDVILRKLFSRSVKRIAPNWKIQEANNGETALRMVDSNNFDLIFVDQYMASVEKQLLGTETVRALRSKGVKSRICGLSANDVEQSFFDAGADAFMFKPFPCQKEIMRRELVRVIGGHDR